MLGSIPYSPTSVPKMSTVFENGTSASVAHAVNIEIAGASANIQPIEPLGRNCCLKSSLPMSAIGCRAPYGPTRLGP